MGIMCSRKREVIATAIPKPPHLKISPEQVSGDNPFKHLLNCPICKLVLWHPVFCPECCQHICQACCVEGQPGCALCKANTAMKKAIPLLVSQLSHLKLKCMGCHGKYFYEVYSKHLEECRNVRTQEQEQLQEDETKGLTAENKVVQSESIILFDQDQRNYKLALIEETCDLCGKQYSDLKYHQLVCSERMLECKYCNATLNQVQMLSHEFFCAQAPTKCEICNSLMTNQEFPHHDVAACGRIVSAYLELKLKEHHSTIARQEKITQEVQRSFEQKQRQKSQLAFCFQASDASIAFDATFHQAIARFSNKPKPMKAYLNKPIVEFYYCQFLCVRIISSNLQIGVNTLDKLMNGSEDYFFNLNESNNQDTVELRYDPGKSQLSLSNLSKQKIEVKRNCNFNDSSYVQIKFGHSGEVIEVLND